MVDHVHVLGCSRHIIAVVSTYESLVSGDLLSLFIAIIYKGYEIYCIDIDKIASS